MKIRDGGAELDLLLMRHGKRIGFEFKFQDAPRPTKSMHVVLQDLGLDSLYIVYPGTRSYALDEHIKAIALNALTKDLGE